MQKQESVTAHQRPTGLGKPQRNALGDISNRTRGTGVTGYGLAKKTTKPGFTVAVGSSIETRSKRREAEKLGMARKPLGAVETNRADAAVTEAGKKIKVDEHRARSSASSSSSRNSRSTSSTTTAKVSNNLLNPAHPEKEFTVQTRPKKGISPIDADDLNKPQCAAEYVSEIYEHQRSVEAQCIANPKYMQDQTDINERMRAILIDWLVEVHYKFKLMPQTLYLTVNTLDRFLERKVVTRKKLQLVGCTAMLLASKYEEIYAPELQDFVYISDHAFDRNDILCMEGIMLNTLKFSMTVPISYIFATRFLKIAASLDVPHVDSQTKHLVNYIMERTLQEYSMLKYLPSTVAAAALYLALTSRAAVASASHESSDALDEVEMTTHDATPVRSSHRELRGADDTRAMSIADSPHVENEKPWSRELEQYIDYTENEIAECCDDIRHLIQLGESKSLQAVKKKYSAHKFMSVCYIPIV